MEILVSYWLTGLSVLRLQASIETHQDKLTLRGFIKFPQTHRTPQSSLESGTFSVVILTTISDLVSVLKRKSLLVLVTC